MRARLAAVAILSQVCATLVNLATAHVNHDTAIKADFNRAAWCQHCHIVHGRPGHIRRQSIIYLRWRACGDLFPGRDPTG